MKRSEDSNAFDVKWDISYQMEILLISVLSIWKNYESHYKEQFY